MKRLLIICFNIIFFQKINSQVILLQNPEFEEKPFYSSVFLMNDNYQSDENSIVTENENFEIIKEFKIPMDPIFNNEVFVLKFLYKKDSLGYYITFDANNNEIFSDDSTFSFKTQQPAPVFPTIKIERSFAHFKCKKFVFFIQPNLTHCNYDFAHSEEKNRRLCVLINTYKKGVFEIKGNKYNFYIQNNNIKEGLLFCKKNTKILFSGDKQNQIVSESDVIPYRIGDTINIAESYYKLSNISNFGDSLILDEVIPYKPNIGINVGQMVPDFHAKSILTGSSINIDKFNNKYILLDFWGTWCKPCIEIIPALKEIFRTTDNNILHILSIAYENSNVSKDSVLKFALKHGIIGDIILEYDQKTSRSLVNNILKIRAYPTIILVDPTGKIVFREEGTDAPNKLSEKFKELSILR